MNATVTGMGHAVPDTYEQQDLWDQFFITHFNNSPLAKRLFSHVGVQRRHAVAAPMKEDVSNWSTERRMSRYVEDAFPLALEAAKAALSDSNTEAKDIGAIFIASCTGYAAPGLDSMIASALGMPVSIERTVVGHMGCYAALPALSNAHDFVAVHNRAAIVCCVELSSLHVQPPTTDPEQMVAHALFSDAAAAVVIEPVQQGGLTVIDRAVHVSADQADLMTWNITDLGFRMRLSADIPNALQPVVAPLINELLVRNGLTVGDISKWAAHPGGPRILDVVQKELGLQDEQLLSSRHVLAEHGNCSSATTLLVLEDIRANGLDTGDYVVALAFGPGLTLYATLLRQS